MVHEEGDLGIVGSAPEVARLRDQIVRLAAFDAPGKSSAPTVLLHGETGTGKGVVARAMHRVGPRRAGPFVDVNCAAIPESMLEAELFGFEAGAFTDAKRAKAGLFESASGGILFLDEIDSLPLALQGKVLGAIEEKRVRRLGATAATPVDVKVIAATQRDLATLAAEGRFRADLYHRLAVVVLTLPPLRARGDDIVLLARHFLAHFAALHGTEPRPLADDAAAWLRAAPWPGNVRELSHLLERVVLLGTSPIVDAALLAQLATTRASPPTTRSDAPAPSEAPNDVPSMDDEARAIRDALVRTGGNVARAARHLGIGRNALRYRMRRFGITRDALDGDVSSGEHPAPSDAGPSTAPPEVGPRAADTGAPIERKPVATLVVAIEIGLDERGGDPWTASRKVAQQIAERVTGFGGTVLEHTTTRACAVFGAPLALERTAERAVNAALALVRSAPAGTTLRLAVHTGEVRVAIGADGTPLMLPVGDAIAFADRLVGHAGPREVLLSSATAKRLAGRHALAPRTLRLGADPAGTVLAHAVAAEPRPTMALVPDDRTTFVGRDDELSIVRRAFGEACRGHGQIVFVSGEAGIGKSRLVAELRRHLEGTEHVWVVGHCTPYGTTTPFRPVADGIRSFFGIDDRDDDAAATAKITAGMAPLGDDLAWTTPYLQHVLALRIDDPAVRDLDVVSRRAETARALRTVTERLAERTPLVLVVEDLHWVDPDSEQYLIFLADLIETARILLVLTHRPGWAPPFGDRTYHQHVRLRPLTDTAVDAMTAAVFGTRSVPATLRELIARKADGNPFFIEELGRTLLEDGVVRIEGDAVVPTRTLSDVVIPDTVQEVLLARLERLPVDAREALQVAAVIGREFALRLLARLTEAGEHLRGHVDTLRALELIYQTTSHPELAYMFKHALTHDVAYRSVEAARRRALHHTIGRVVEELYADRLAEHYEALAHHFEVAEAWPSAFEYHRRATDKAAAAFASQAVVTHAEAALAIAGRLGHDVDDATRRHLWERLAVAHRYLSRFGAAGAAFERAAALASGETSVALLGLAADNHLWGHDYAAYERTIATVVALDPTDATAEALRGFAAGVLEGDLDGLERRSTHALQLVTGRAARQLEARARHNLALAAEWRGDFAAAIRHTEAAIEIARASGAPDIMIFATWFLGKAHTCLGDYGVAFRVLREAYDVCDRIGDRAWKSRLLNTMGWCLAEVELDTMAVDYNRRAAELAADLGDDEIVSNSAINLAKNFVGLGDLDRARRVLEPIEAQVAVADADPWMRWRYGLHVLDARARIELADGAPDRALALARRAATGARDRSAPKLEVRALELAGRCLAAMDERDEADALLCDAGRIAAGLGYARAAWEIPALRAVLATRSGRATDAGALGAHAAGAASRLADTLGDVLPGDDLRTAASRLASR